MLPTTPFMKPKALTAALTVGLATLGGAGGEAHGDDERARFAGTFVWSGDAREEAARRAAIDRGVETFFFAIRGIARSRLSAGTRIDPSIGVAFEPGKIRIRVPNAPDAVSPETGAAVDYVADGERSKLSQRLANGRLVQLFAAEEGRRTNELLVSPDGAVLTMRVVVASPKLSAPVVYTLTYRRSKS